jgi:hypothetical protein
MKRSAPVKSVAPEDDNTGLPWLPTWNGVYLVVILSFVLWVVLLIVLTDFFS